MDNLFLRAMLLESGPSRRGNSETSIGGQILGLLKKASHTSAMDMTTELRIQAMCEARNLLYHNIETVKGFGDEKEDVENSLNDIDVWIEKTRKLQLANTLDEILTIVRPWTSGHLSIQTPHGTRAERRVRKVFRHAAMRRLWEISSDVLLDEE